MLIRNLYLVALLLFTLNLSITECQNDVPYMTYSKEICQLNPVTDGGGPGEYSGYKVVVKPAELVRELQLGKTPASSIQDNFYGFLTPAIKRKIIDEVIQAEKDFTGSQTSGFDSDLLRRNAVHISPPIFLNRRKYRPKQPASIVQQSPPTTSFRPTAEKVIGNCPNIRNYPKPVLNTETVSPSATVALAAALLQKLPAIKRQRHGCGCSCGCKCGECEGSEGCGGCGGCGGCAGGCGSGCNGSCGSGCDCGGCGMGCGKNGGCCGQQGDSGGNSHGCCLLGAGGTQSQKCPLAELFNGGSRKPAKQAMNCCCGNCCCNNGGAGRRTPPNNNYKLKFMQNTRMEIALGNNAFGSGSKPFFSNALNSMFKFTKNLVRPLRRTINQFADTANKSVKRVFIIEKSQNPSANEHHVGTTTNINRFKSVVLNEDSTPPPPTTVKGCSCRCRPEC